MADKAYIINASYFIVSTIKNYSLKVPLLIYYVFFQNLLYDYRATKKFKKTSISQNFNNTSNKDIKTLLFSSVPNESQE